MVEKLEFEVHLKPSYKKFHKNDWGIYAVTVNEDSPNQDKIEIDDFNREINLVGIMPLLEDEKTYIASVTVKTHPKFGKQYEVKTIYKQAFSTRDEQELFIKTILTELQVKNIVEAYPTENLIDLFKNDKLDVALVKGIGQNTYEKLKLKILENEKYQLAIVELTSKYGVPYNAVKRLSDKYGSPDLLLQKINENPYLLTNIDGFGFKKVDEIALQMGVEKKSSHRVKACIEYVLNENSNNGHSWIKRTKLISDSIKLLGIKIADVQDVIDNMDIEGKDVFFVEPERAYLFENFMNELKISKDIERLLNAKNDIVVPNVEEAIAEVEEKQGFKFTTEQVLAIRFAIDYNVVVVNGKAGTGKTAVIKGIVEVLKKVEGLEYSTCALSGKASQRIQESTGLDSSTMHRLLGFNPQTGWAYDDKSPLGQDVIILDEASMVNSQLFYYLIRAIKNGAKFIITGDIAQLEPIGVGNVLVDLLKSDAVPSVELTIVHRQAQMSGILSSANLVREGKRFLKNNDFANKRLGELQDLYVYPYKDGEKVLETTLKIASKYEGDILDFQVLVPMKTRGLMSTQNLNKELQLIFNTDPTFVDKRRKIETKNCTFLQGDKVIINGNNYDKGVFNGTMGIIDYIDSSIKEGEIVIEFEGAGRLTFNTEDMKQIDLGYAITIHKSQGSQWKFVLMALDYASYVLLNRQSAYTGMTRASQALFLVVELKALQYAIDTDKSSLRNTFLDEMLDKVTIAE